MSAMLGAYITNSVVKFFRKVIEKEHPEFTEREVTAEFFLRFYGEEFSDKQKERIAAFLVNTK